jgi:hypothetical protein
MSQLPHQKVCHDSLVSFILVLSGKSSWVLSRTQGFVPTCCRWADVLRLLYQLPLSCNGRSLGPWAMVIRYISSDAFVGIWSWTGTVFWTLRACVIWTKCFRYFHSKLVCNNYVKTLMYLWRELLCNLWWWPLNLLRSWLVCKLVWNPSWFHGLPGYTGLSLLNRLLGGWFSYLISYNWSVLLQLASEHGLACLLFTSVFKTKMCLKTWFTN